jgi:cytochrome b subunit of formate dehydrogenase
MLFFRRRDTLNHSNLTDQERCIHACLFFAFILLILTIVFFYFAATYKGTDEQRLYYYLGAGISLACLILITLCTIIYIRRFYGHSVSTTHQRRITTDSEYDSSKYSNNNP